MQKNEKIEFRGFDLAVNESPSDAGILEGIACVFNKPTVIFKDKDYELREMFLPEAFDGSDLSDVIFNYNHRGRVYARTRNQSLFLTVENDGLHMRAVLNMADEGHKQLHRDVRNRLIDKMSFAFTVKDEEYRSLGFVNGIFCEERIVKKVEKVYDVTAVDIPAYDETSISARSVFDAAKEKRCRANAERVKNKLKLKLKMEGIF